MRSDDFVEDVLADVAVDGAERVVEVVDVLVGVDGARQADALLLAAAQVDALVRSNKNHQENEGNNRWRTVLWCLVSLLGDSVLRRVSPNSPGCHHSTCCRE